jgi:hypothetical protein
MADDIREELFELDRKIYADVFRGKLFTRAEMKKMDPYEKRAQGDYWFPEGFYAKKSATGQVTYRQEIPRYSTDIKDAFLVVTAMREQGFAFRVLQMAVDPALTITDHAIVDFVCSSGPCERHGNKQQNHHGAYHVEGKTIEQAICLAALKALGKDAYHAALVCRVSAPCGQFGNVTVCNRPLPCRLHKELKP